MSGSGKLYYAMWGDFSDLYTKGLPSDGSSPHLLQLAINTAAYRQANIFRHPILQDSRPSLEDGSIVLDFDESDQRGLMCESGNSLRLLVPVGIDVLVNVPAPTRRTASHKLSKSHHPPLSLFPLPTPKTALAPLSVVSITEPITSTKSTNAVSTS